MRKLFLLLLAALVAGCIPPQVVEKETGEPGQRDSIPRQEEELEPPEEAGEQPPLPEDLDPVIEVPEDEEPGEPLRRERYVVRGDSSLLVGEGDPRISRIWKVYGYSDSLEFWGDEGIRYSSAREGRDEIRLVGNARIVDRGSVITGREGFYDMDTRVAEMRDSVTIVDGDAVIHCDFSRWDRERRRSLLTGEVSIDYRGNTVLADTVRYDQHRRKAEGFGKVRVTNVGAETRITGRHGSFDLENEVTIMDEDPVLHRREEGDSSRTTAREMRHFRAESLMVAVGDVHYSSEQIQAFGDSALFYQARDRMDLFQEPRLEWDRSTLRGDTLRLYLENQDPVYMDVEGAAVYEKSNPDSLVLGGRHTRITGSHFGIFFSEGDIRQVRVQGPAQSVYTPDLEPGESAQVHEASGDSMAFSFAEEELDEVHVRGGAQGRSWSLEHWEDHLAAADSLPADSLSADSLAGRGPRLPFDQLASSYAYRADSLRFQVPEELVDLLGSPAEVEEAFHLSGDSIRLDSGEEFLVALGEPIFTDGEQELYGDSMQYDLATGEGMVYGGVTTLGNGYFRGPRMKKVGEKDINVSDAVYTTCDHDPPHSGFHMDKVRAEDQKVFASPVVLKIGEVPIFALPTFFLDLKRGRRSGVLVPNFEFGINADRQRFVRNMGIYWAASQYWDLLLRGDFIEDSSLMGSTTLNYRKRYWKGGSFNGQWRYDIKEGLGDYESRDWGLMGSHTMTVGEDTRINSSVNFASSEDLRDTDHYSVDETINQRLTSNLNLSTKLGTMPLSTGFNMTQYLGKEDEDPDTDNLVRQVSTPLSLSWPGLSLPLVGGMKLSLPSFKYTRTEKVYEEHTDVDEKIPASVGLSKNLGPWWGLSIKPSAGYSATWSHSSETVTETVYRPFGSAEAPEEGAPGSTLDDLESLEETEVEVAQNWKTSTSRNFGVSLNYKVYGLFYPRGASGANLPFRLGPVTAIRHTFAPSASASYSESFSGGRRSISRSLSLAAEHTFDYKTGAGEEAIKHNGVVTWSLRTSLNPEEWPDDDPWNTLSSSVRIRPGQGVSITMNHSWDPNTWALTSSTLSGNFAKTFTVRIGSFLAKEGAEELAEQIAEHRPALPGREGEAGGASVLPGGFTGGGPGTALGASAPSGEPGALSLQTNFSMNRTLTGQLTPNLRLSSSFQLSKNWSLAWSGDLELENGSFGTQRLSVVRDLHCWECRFTRLIYQDEPQYYFVIYLREHPEVKQEFGNRAVGGQGGLY